MERSAELSEEEAMWCLSVFQTYASKEGSNKIRSSVTLMNMLNDLHTSCGSVDEADAIFNRCGHGKSYVTLNDILHFLVELKECSFEQPISDDNQLIFTAKELREELCFEFDEKVLADVERELSSSPMPRSLSARRYLRPLSRQTETTTASMDPSFNLRHTSAARARYHIPTHHFNRAALRSLVSSGATSTLANSLHSHVLLMRKLNIHFVPPLQVPLPLPKFYHDRRWAKKDKEDYANDGFGYNDVSVSRGEVPCFEIRQPRPHSRLLSCAPSTDASGIWKRDFNTVETPPVSGGERKLQVDSPPDNPQSHTKSKVAHQKLRRKASMSDNQSEKEKEIKRTVKNLFEIDKKINNPKARAAPVVLARMIGAIEVEAIDWSEVEKNDRKLKLQKKSPYSRPPSRM